MQKGGIDRTMIKLIRGIYYYRGGGDYNLELDDDFIMPDKFKKYLATKYRKFLKPIEFIYGFFEKEDKIYHAISVCHPIKSKFSFKTGSDIVLGRLQRLYYRGYQTYGMIKHVYKTVINNDDKTLIQKTITIKPNKIHELPHWVEVTHGG